MSTQHEQVILLRDLDETELLDLLSEFTVQFTRMLHDNDRGKKFYECRRMIEKIITEIAARREVQQKQAAVGGIGQE